jgi:nicotinamide mononucleotide transporter
VAEVIVAAITALSPWEASAAVLAIAYLLLAAREHIACWLCAFVSTAIYTALFWHVSLLMDSALNIYYMAMAGFGWYQWRHGSASGGQLAISTWPVRRHLLVIGTVIALALITGKTLSVYTAAAWPYVDSLTTWGAVITTYMVARKVLENWLYWFVLDAISIPLYIERGLHVTAALFAIYLVIVVIGFFSWQRQYLAAHHAPHPA